MFDYSKHLDLVAYAPNNDVHLSPASLVLINQALSEFTSADWLLDGEPLEAAEADELDEQLAQAFFEANTAIAGGAGNPMIGMIFPYITTNPPEDCLPCDGTEYLGADYPDLFAVILTGLKTDETHFITPDLRDKFVFGASATREPLTEGGAETVTLTNAQVPTHLHSYDPPGSEVIIRSATGTPNVAVHRTTGAPTTQTTTSGSGGSHNNLPPFMSIKYAIKAL